MGDWRLVVAAASAGLLGACTGSASEPDASPTIPVATPSPTPTTTPTPEDPYAIPDEIDEAYLNRVFEALERVIGDATRLIVAQKTYPPDVDDLLGSVYSTHALQVVRDAWGDALLLDPELSRYGDPPGDRVVLVEAVLGIDPTCVFVAVTRDFSGVIAESVPTETVFMALRRHSPMSPNPTPWIIDRQAKLADDLETPEGSLCDSE